MALDTLFIRKVQFLYEKLVLGQPNGLQTFSTQAMEVIKKLTIFSIFFIMDTVTNFERKKHVQGRIFNTQIIRFQCS